MIVLATVLASMQAQQPIERQFDVGAETAEVYVRNEDGRTELTSHDARRVDVRVTKEVVRARDDEQAQRLADEVEVRIEERNGRVEVETIHPERSWRFSRDTRVLVHIEIRAPRSTNLDVATEDGPLDVSGFDGTLRLRSEDGDVAVAGCSGAVDIVAEDGDVHLTDFEGEIRADVEDGGLDVEGIIGALDVESEDGGVDVRARAGSRMKGDWSVRAADGRVRLELPDDFAAELDIRADDGSIRVDRPVTVQGKHSSREVTGTLNEGGHTVRVRAQDGSIRITTG